MRKVKLLFVDLYKVQHYVDVTFTSHKDLLEQIDHLERLGYVLLGGIVDLVEPHKDRVNKDAEEYHDL